MKIRLLSLVIAIFVLVGCQTSPEAGSSATNGMEETVSEWLSYGSSQITFLCPSDTNLKRLEARLRTRYFSVSASERDLFVNSSYPVEKRILARLESILLRTEQVLAMYPSMDLKIKIFRTREELSLEHLRLTGMLKRYKSFYIHGFETIYSSMQDISDSVIAHEMAHAVIDHYFRVPPPEKAAELLTTYVDSHLEKE